MLLPIHPRRWAPPGGPRSSTLPTPNYSFEKRQRELAKKRKAEEKRQKKLARTGEPAADAQEPTPAEPAPDAEPPKPSAG